MNCKGCNNYQEDLSRPQSLCTQCMKSAEIRQVVALERIAFVAEKIHNDGLTVWPKGH